MNRPVETYWQTVYEVKRLSLLNWTGFWRCLKPHSESPSHRFCGYGSTPFIFRSRRTSHEGSIRVRFSGHWKPALNDDQPDSYLALKGKVGTRTTSMELPNELAYQSSVLKLFTMFKTKVRWDGTCVSKGLKLFFFKARHAGNSTWMTSMNCRQHYCGQGQATWQGLI